MSNAPVETIIQSPLYFKDFVVLPTTTSYILHLVVFIVVFSGITVTITNISAKSGRFTPNMWMLFDILADNYDKSIKQLDAHIKNVTKKVGFENMDDTPAVFKIDDTLYEKLNSWISSLFVRGRTISRVVI